jgi:hypothetical protein
MILGMSLDAFTDLHVILSLIGIASGVIVVFGMLAGKELPRWTALFLATTGLTSATGFLFPVERVLPSHVVGAISLAVLAIALFALYARRLAGAWRWIFVVSAVLSLYLNVFVGVVQAFLKQPFLKPLAPTQSEPPFILAQGVVLLAFAVLGILAVRAFRPAGRRTSSPA